MTDCLHNNIAVEANTNHVKLASGETGARMLSVKATCADCGAKFWFPGMPTGISYNEPTTSTDGFSLVAPLALQNTRHAVDPSLTSYTVRNNDILKGYRR